MDGRVAHGHTPRAGRAEDTVHQAGNRERPCVRGAPFQPKRRYALRWAPLRRLGGEGEDAPRLILSSPADTVHEQACEHVSQPVPRTPTGPWLNARTSRRCARVGPPQPGGARSPSWNDRRAFERDCHGAARAHVRAADLRPPPSRQLRAQAQARARARQLRRRCRRHCY